MKQLFTLLALTAATLSFSQTNCGDLFISEYVEGWGNNKALEIYNPTNQAINLNGYFQINHMNFMILW